MNSGWSSISACLSSRAVRLLRNSFAPNHASLQNVHQLEDAHLLLVLAPSFEAPVDAVPSTDELALHLGRVLARTGFDLCTYHDQVREKVQVNLVLAEQKVVAVTVLFALRLVLDRLPPTPPQPAYRYHGLQNQREDSDNYGYPLWFGDELRQSFAFLPFRRGFGAHPGTR